MNDHVVTDKVFLFTDLHNFSIVMTALRERAAEMLQGYYVFAGDIITNSGGTILKYMGDSVFAIFDSGMETDAVRSAIVMKERFAGFANSFGVGYHAPPGSRCHRTDIRFRQKHHTLREASRHPAEMEGETPRKMGRPFSFVSPRPKI